MLGVDCLRMASPSELAAHLLFQMEMAWVACVFEVK